MAFRERGNVGSTRKVVLDPRLSYELGRIKKAIPRVTYGTAFPPMPKVGDFHYFSGETDGSFVTNNWYAAKPENKGWQSINAQSVIGSNISGGIPSGVTIADYLSKFGGTMEGVIEFFKDQVFQGKQLRGAITSGVTIEDYLSLYGGTMQGGIILSGFNLARVGNITGKDTDIKITLGTDGEMKLEADDTITIDATTLVLLGALGITGDVTISGDLQVNGTNIGISTDTDLITMADNLLTITGALTATTIITGDSLVLGKASTKGIKVDTVAPTFGFADIIGDQFAKNTGATKPTLSAYNGVINSWLFGVSDEAFMSFHIPHDYVVGTEIFIHVHWSHIGTLVTGGTVTFKVTSIYAKGHNQSAFTGTPAVGTFTDAASAIQYQHIISEVSYSDSSPTGLEIDQDLLEPDGVIEMTFEVDANDLTVSGGGVPDIFVHFVDIHYQSTGVMGTKQKAPDFYT